MITTTANILAIETGKIAVPVDGTYFYSSISMNEREHPSGRRGGFTYTACAAVGTSVAEDADDDPVKLVVGRAFVSFGFVVACDADGVPLALARPQFMTFTTISNDDVAVIEDESYCAADVEDLDVYGYTAHVRLLGEGFLRDPETAERRFVVVDVTASIADKENVSVA